jgi:hypothetical protein
MALADKVYAIHQRLDALIALGADTGWHNLGAPGNGWTVTSARYRSIGMGLVFLEFRGLVPGTVTNGTVVFIAANGLPSGLRPTQARRIVFGAVGTVGAAGNPELEFETDGSIQCQNVVAGVTGMDANVLLSVVI